ncbi:hypothetical protein GV053_12505 [Marinomonas mediterranea MMB-1]|uniref:immunoglobulin-like domain-containing protein n=1 Tax=Marinomonas mediterranea TaxID=119864 RepID=UPI00234BE184|nr:immunoglobulin-like domain-containing protein [Marinomonas mediterranea]WCN17800.1 hypothetical protein GV053_12505 [Marinomonas mediterranea MMB-1]
MIARQQRLKITDTTDDTTVSLSATGSITEAGGTVTYTAELTSAAEGDVTVTLSNGETITIADGENSRHGGCRGRGRRRCVRGCGQHQREH